jgi:hypothetical protein
VSRIYTPEEDELIKAAGLDELQGLANMLGRKRHNVLNRRTRLLRGDDLRAEYRRPPPAAASVPARSTRDVLAGRPAWFDDIGVLHTRLRSGR